MAVRRLRSAPSPVVALADLAPPCTFPSFIVSGLITIFWGAIGLYFIPDSPINTRAHWLTKDERALALARTQAAGIKGAERIPGKVLWRKIRLIVRSPIAYLFLAGYLQFAWSQRANSYFLLYLKGLEKADGSALYSCVAALLRPRPTRLVAETLTTASPSAFRRVYKVNLIPMGGYAISMVSNIGLNAIADATGWRWQIATFAAVRILLLVPPSLARGARADAHLYPVAQAIQLVCTAVLASWPASTTTKMVFYFGTYATAAWGYAFMTWVRPPSLPRPRFQKSPR